MTDTILLLGDPRLRQKSAPMEDLRDPQFLSESIRLKNALDTFRQQNGSGRGIAAPQIGIHKRFIALNLGDGTFTMINPVITWRSEKTFTLWDDCISFPDLLVKVSRFTSISLTFLDESGQLQQWNNLDRARSELLQHEIDHLDGILAIDRALDSESIIYRSVFEKNRKHFERQVDYLIEPTIATGQQHKLP
jgi:peptide deformylase